MAVRWNAWGGFASAQKESSMECILGAFQNSGTVTMGDPVSVVGQQFEPIPYAVKDRIHWFMTTKNASLGVRDLAHALGLPSSYARAPPYLVKGMGFARR
jgi:hypothetical protein